MSADKEHAELLSIRAKLIEKGEEERREHLQRQAWINDVLEAWDDKKYPTFGAFIASPEGQKFYRRYEDL